MPVEQRREQRLQLLREREIAARERGRQDVGEDIDVDVVRPFVGYPVYAYGPYSVFGYGYGFGLDPFWYPYDSYAYAPYWGYDAYLPYVAYDVDSEDDVTTEIVDAVPIEVGTEVEAGDFVTGDDLLAVEQLTDEVVRVTWAPPPESRAVREVSFFVADEDQVVLVVQTSREPPYGAVFEPPAATGYVGVVVTWDDDTQSTGLLRYVGPPAE